MTPFDRAPTDRGRKSSLDTRTRTLRMEILEDRRMLAAFTVDSILDNFDPGAPTTDGMITLREAILAANTNSAVGDAPAGSGADTIDFSVTGTINLAFGQLGVTDDLAINGPGASQLTIDAGGSSRIFDIDDGNNANHLAVEIRDLTLTGGNTSASGGAVRSLESLTLADSVISGSSALASGGGIYARAFSGATTTINDSSITGNTINANYGAGGGIAALTDSGAATTIDRSTISGNSVNGRYDVGGGIFANTFVGGTLTIANSTIAGNVSASNYSEGAYGGGVHLFDNGATTITNSTISGNSAKTRGGGIYASGYGSATVAILHSTVTGNMVSYGSGGGIGAGGSGVSLDHTIVAVNTGGGAPDIDGTVVSRYSLIGDDTGATITDNGGNQIGTSGSVIDPLLDLLADNGGLTQTHALLAGSLAIDVGDPGAVAGVGNVPAFDQRGAPIGRVLGAAIDIGAVERIPDEIVVDNVVDENDGDYSDGDLSLREAVVLANNGPGLTTILFDASLDGATILLGLGQMLIEDELVIDARPLDENVTIDAQQQSRIFHITANLVDYTLAGLTLTGGRTVAIGESGGAIRFTGNGSLTLDQSIVSGNSTLGQSSPGGGIFSNGSLTLTQSTVSGNSTADSFSAGGGISSTGAVTLTQSTVGGNSTSGINTSSGGGISAGGSGITLTQSTVSGNSTSGNSDGGGVFSSGPVMLIHSTVTDNHTTYANPITTGGGIWNTGDPVTISHSIVAGNTSAGGGDDLDPGTGTLTIDFSLIGDNDGTGLAEAQIADVDGNLIGSAAGSGIINPLLGPLANNGGPTKTHALLPDSPALDAGDPGFVGPPENDQRGLPFVRVAGGRIDMGAYELQSLALVVDTLVDESDGDFSPGDLSLREALEITNANPGADSVSFDAGLSGSTIILTLGELAITDDVIINGPGASNLTIDANNDSRIFNIDDGDSASQLIVAVDGLTLTQGDVGPGGVGGAIRSVEDLSVTNSTISNSNGFFSGGGLYSSGSLSVSGSTISGNTAGDGGGIYIKLVAGGTAMIQGSTISGNYAFGDGGGVSIRADAGAAVTINGSTLTGNFGDDGGGVFAYSTGGSITTIQSSTISGNRGGEFGANSQSYNGGGISARTAGGATMTIQSSTISGNSGLRGGGLYLRSNNGGVTDLIDSDVVDNGQFYYGYSYKGGGIYARVGTGSAMSIAGTSVRLNIAYYGGDALGGGIFLRNSGTATITDSTIHENRATGGIAKGGGIYTLGGGNMTIANSTISSNDVNYYAGTVVNSHSYGGGLYADTGSGGTLTITGVTISDNQIEGEFVAGGGISLGSLDYLGSNLGETIISGSTISRNVVDGETSSSTGGGADIHANTNGSGTTTITGTTISKNNSHIDGGGVLLQGTGTSTITGTTIFGNSSFYDGGGVHLQGTGMSTITGTTISGNASYSNGGGVHAEGVGSVTISHSTITRNTSDVENGGTGSGGGIFVPPSNFTLNHTIVAGNIDNTAVGPDINGTVTAQFSLIGNNTGVTITDNGGNQIGDPNVGGIIDPLLGPLANSGGLTKTHALLVGSPTIDAGDSSIVAPPASDQRGAPFLRVADGGVSGVRIDIGAYERQAIAGLPPLVVDTAADENDADYSAGDLSLREAVGLANGNIGVADTIEFAPGLTGAIALVLGQLKIVDSVTLTGPGADILAIDAQGRSRVLNIDDGDDATQLTAHIVDLTFTGGRALGTNIPYLSGGGIRSRENLFLTDSVISNNISSGGLYLRLFSGAAATITGSTIANNFAFNNGRGGGIHVRFEPGATMTIANSTISGNRATKNGGGIYAVGAGDITIAHTTITGNTSEPILGNPSESVGGGISNLSGTLTLNHAIIADNIDSSGVAPDINGTVAAAYSLIGDNTGATITDNGGNQIGDPNVGGVINPLLGPLADNGGPTLTHALMTGSPALDMGDVATSPGVSGVPLFDQRGNNYGRVQNGRIDIGAFEVRETVSADFDIDNDIDGFDFLLWQRGFGTPAPNAAKSDGDADNDLDAEGGDLGVWESQFGQPAPAVAASSSSAISYSSTSESVNEESPLTSVSVVGLTSLSSAPQQAAASIDATPVSVAEKSLVTLATPTSVQLASAAQAISGFSTIILRAGVFKSHLNTVRGNLFEVNGLPKANDFAEFVDLAFEQAWDDLDSSAHEYGNLVRKIANYVEGGYRKSHARVVDGVFATLAEEEEFVGLRPLL